MSILKTYLAEVASFLPKHKRDDILNELESSIQEQFDERSGELGRTLNQQEELQQLKRWGHPMKVAGAYLPMQYLIGPSLLPLFWHVLKLAAAVVVAIHLTLWVIGAWIAGDGSLSLWDLATQVLNTLLFVAANVVVVFALLEYSGQKLAWLENWNPSSLLNRARTTVNRSDMVSNLVTEGIFLLWWNGSLALPASFVYKGTEVVSALSPAWQSVFWPVNCILGLAFILHLWLLIHSHWHLWTACADLFLNLAILPVVLYILGSDPLVELHISVAANTESFHLSIEQGVRYALWFILLVILYDLYKQSRNIWQLRLQRVPGN